MKEKNLLKKVTDLNMPNIEAIRQQSISSKKQTHHPFQLKHLIPVGACCCLIVLSIITFTRSPYQNENHQLFDKNPTNGAAFSTDNNKDNPTEGNASKENIIIFNDINNHSFSADKSYFDSQKTYQKQMTASEVFDYLGKDIRPTILPEGLKDYTREYPHHTFDIVYNNDGTVAFDQFIFAYQEDFEDTDYNPLSKKLTITASKEIIIKDYIYVWKEDMRPSVIHNQELMVGREKIPYGPYTVVEDGPNIPSGYYDLLIAEFKRDNINYEIIAENFTEAEFVETVSSMI